MTDPPEEPLDAQELDEFYQIAVDGRSIFRIEEISEFQQSAVDEAVIAHTLAKAAESIADDLEAEHDKRPEEIVEAVEPRIEDFDSEVGEWE